MGDTSLFRRNFRFYGKDGQSAMVSEGKLNTDEDFAFNVIAH